MMFKSHHNNPEQLKGRVLGGNLQDDNERNLEAQTFNRTVNAEQPTALRD